MTTVPKYDPEREKQLVAELADLEKQISDSAADLKDRKEAKGDEGWDAATQDAYTADSIDHMRLQNTRTDMRAELAVIQLAKPAEKVGLSRAEIRDGSTFLRAIREGTQGLAKEELDEINASINEAGFDGDRRPGAAGTILLTTGLSPLQVAKQRQLASMFADRKRGFTLTPDGSNSSVDMGDFVDTDTEPTVVETLKHFGGASQFCGAMPTAKGNDKVIPQEDETSQEGERLNSGQSATQGDPAASSSVTLKAYTYSSKMIDISLDLLNDVDWDVEGHYRGLCFRRIGRAMNRDFTKGTGSDQPQGFMDAPKEVAAASSTGITFPDEPTKLIYQVNEAYLGDGEGGMGGLPTLAGVPGVADGMIGFSFNRSTEGLMLEAKETDSGKPLWEPDITGRVPGFIRGYPYIRNAHIDSVAAGGNKSVVFGNGNYHKIRIVNSVMVHVFWDSGTAPSRAIRILGFGRADSRHILKPEGGKNPSLCALKHT